MEEWRTFLYPLGFISSIAFGLRFIMQWIQSERAQNTIVTRSFWKISLAGNLLLTLHSFIQFQYHLCLVQICNAVISWRNLNLMQTRRPPASFLTVLALLAIACFLTTVAFSMQERLLEYDGSWFRIPSAPWQRLTEHHANISFFWNVLGTFGYWLFSSRFWVQWWLAEKAHASHLPLSFWWLSLIGAILSLAYFLRIEDTVNLMGPLLGIIPYVRNLMILKNKQAVLQK